MLVVTALLLSAYPVAAEGSVSGEFPNRTFFVTRSPPRGPRSDTLTVDLVPSATGEWWVTADVIAGSAVAVGIWKEDGGSLVIVGSSTLRSSGEESTKILVTAGSAYKASFTPYGKPGTSILREWFTVHLEWVREFGTAGPDAIYDIAVDGSDVYAAGSVAGALPGQSGAGWLDAFVRKYDADGDEIWTRQFGTSGGDWIASLGIDATGVYVTGLAAGALPGQTSPGIFLRKYDADGNDLWTRQFDTSGTDNVFGVTVDGTAAYIVGSTDGTLPGQSNAGSTDAYVRKYDPEGNEVWTRQFGTPDFDGAFWVDADPSGVYVVGSTTGVLAGDSNAGSHDAFIRKYDADGNAVWTRQFGTVGTDQAFAVDVEGTGVYVAGRTEGTEFWSDAFVRKYDSDGNEIWARDFGVEGLRDEAFAVDVDGEAVYVGGLTAGTLPGQSSAGSDDAFVRRYDPDGNEVWTRQFGTSGADAAHDVDGAGVYIGGRTEGAFPGYANAGFDDAFFARLEP